MHWLHYSSYPRHPSAYSTCFIVRLVVATLSTCLRQMQLLVTYDLRPPRAPAVPGTVPLYTSQGRTLQESVHALNSRGPSRKLSRPPSSHASPRGVIRGSFNPCPLSGPLTGCELDMPDLTESPRKSRSPAGASSFPFNRTTPPPPARLSDKALQLWVVHRDPAQPPPRSGGGRIPIAHTVTVPSFLP